jgi:hypothetical protein
VAENPGKTVYPVSIHSTPRISLFYLAPSLHEDPKFKNPAYTSSERDFSVSKRSPAIAANRKHAAYDIFLQLYGLDIYVDFDGQPRHPQYPTIGAIEAPLEWTEEVIASAGDGGRTYSPLGKPVAY